MDNVHLSLITGDFIIKLLGFHSGSFSLSDTGFLFHSTGTGGGGEEHPVISVTSTVTSICFIILSFPRNIDCGVMVGNKYHSYGVRFHLNQCSQQHPESRELYVARMNMVIAHTVGFQYSG